MPAPEQVFTMGNPLRLELRPPRSVEDLIEWRYVFEGAGGEQRLWEPNQMRTPDGVYKVEGMIGQDIPLEPGTWTLRVLYGWPGRLPAPEALGSGLEAADDWQLLRLPLRVEPHSVGAVPDPPSQSMLEVEVAGCSWASKWPVCAPRGELRLWVRSLPGAEIEIRVGERIVDAAGDAIDGGWRSTVEASAADGEIEVCANDAGREACRSLTLGPDTRSDGYHEASRLASEGKIAEARRLFEEHLSTDESGLEASILSRLARLDGTSAEAAETFLEEALDLHRETRQVQQEARDTAMLVDLDFKRRDLAAADQRLKALKLPENPPAEAAFHRAYNLGMLKSDVGNYRQALRSLGRASDLARRLGLSEGLFAEQMLATALRRLGRTDEAFERLHHLLRAEQNPCDRAELLNNYTWALILHPSADRDDPLPWLEEALDIIEQEGCSRHDLELDLLLNSSLAHVQGDRIWEAQGALDKAQTLADTANRFQRLWWQDIEGRLDLRDGRGLEAADRYQRMEELARQADFPDGVWRAKVGQARAHELLGDSETALGALAAAETLLDAEHLEVPLVEGREAFVAQREEGARLQLQLLLRAGRDADALAVARRSRARVLRALRHGHRLAHLMPEEQARRDDEVAAYLHLRARIEAKAADAASRAANRQALVKAQLEELRQEARRALDRLFDLFPRQSTVAKLPAPRTGEVILAYHPLPDGWVGFAADSSRVISHRFDLPADLHESPEDLSRRLLQPFREMIRTAGRVRVLPYGPLRAVDFHALPFGGDVLLSERPVVYGLDLEVTASEATPGRRALVIPAAPWSGLRAATAEAEAVRDALRNLPEPWSVEFLDSAEATAAEVRDLLPRDFDLLHYSGHGSAGGRFGWEGALHLAGGTRLAVGDVLALDRMPSQVVLSSCETGLEAEEAPVASLGLAQAFLVAGARSVVAALRPVADANTAKLFRDSYRNWDGETDFALSLRQVQLAWRQAEPGADWASFRVFEP